MCMKKMKVPFMSFLKTSVFATALFSFVACSNDTPNGGSGEPDLTGRVHFDIFMSVGEHGGMGGGENTIVKSVESLTADQPMIDIQGSGVELNPYTIELISKGKYYYQVPSKQTRFTKFQIVNNKIEIVQEQPFVVNSYTERKYTHAWLDDKTLLVMAANGDADKIIWTKLNAEDMSILSEGTLDLPLPAGAAVFTTTGILTYNEKVGKLFYFYYGKDKAGRKGVATSNFLTAVINPSDMKVESNKVNALAAEMAGSSYGQLLQECVTYDEEGNLYLAAFTKKGELEEGCLLRINKGESDFDASYNGYPNADGKLCTVQYLGNGKALTYARNQSADAGRDTYSLYYSIVDLKTGKRSRLACDGKEVGYSSGRFSQRSVVLNGKAYIGVNTETSTCIYIYDVAKGVTEKGADIAQGYYFDVLRVVEN